MPGRPHGRAHARTVTGSTGSATSTASGPTSSPAPPTTIRRASARTRRSVPRSGSPSCGRRSSRCHSPQRCRRTAARLGLANGRGLTSLIRQRHPRWVLVVSVSLVTGANVFNIGATCYQRWPITAGRGQLDGRPTLVRTTPAPLSHGSLPAFWDFRRTAYFAYRQVPPLASLSCRR